MKQEVFGGSILVYLIAPTTTRYDPHEAGHVLYAYGGDWLNAALNPAG
ncbi:MAG: hypothetical protein QW506_01010 [Thermoproteota archaeon]